MLCSTNIVIWLIIVMEQEGLSNRLLCICKILLSTAFTQPCTCAGTQHESAAAAARGRGWR